MSLNEVKNIMFVQLSNAVTYFQRVPGYPNKCSYISILDKINLL